MKKWRQGREVGRGKQGTREEKRRKKRKGEAKRETDNKQGDGIRTNRSKE